MVAFDILELMYSHDAKQTAFLAATLYYKLLSYYPKYNKHSKETKKKKKW